MIFIYLHILVSKTDFESKRFYSKFNLKKSCDIGLHVAKQVFVEFRQFLKLA